MGGGGCGLGCRVNTTCEHFSLLGILRRAAALIYIQAVPPELLSKKPDTANIPYNLIDRILAAAGDGDEKDDENVKRKVKALTEAVERRTQGLKKLEGR